MIFLSKNGQDEYINLFAAGCKAKITNSEQFDFDATSGPIMLRGILNKVLKRCIKTGRPFYYMDSGYFGNNVGVRNPHGHKVWHRIVANDLQHNTVIPRPSDRWDRLGISLQPRRHGTKIIIAAPDDKPCKFYKIDREAWIEQTTAAIQRYTDRPIVVRIRAARREDRVHMDPLSRVLVDDVHALVTYNSVAATEAIIMGVPAFTLAPSNAAAPVANQFLSAIDDPFFPDDDQRRAWVSHLAYGQFHVSELKSGQALAMLLEQNG